MERMLRVPRVRVEAVGPGFRWISPDRMTSRVTVELKWRFNGKENK